MVSWLLLNYDEWNRFEKEKGDMADLRAIAALIDYVACKADPNPSGRFEQWMTENGDVPGLILVLREKKERKYKGWVDIIHQFKLIDKDGEKQLMGLFNLDNDCDITGVDLNDLFGDIPVEKRSVRTVASREKGDEDEKEKDEAIRYIPTIEGLVAGRYPVKGNFTPQEGEICLREEALEFRPKSLFIPFPIWHLINGMYFPDAENYRFELDGPYSPGKLIEGMVQGLKENEAVGTIDFLKWRGVLQRTVDFLWAAENQLVFGDPLLQVKKERAAMVHLRECLDKFLVFAIQEERGSSGGVEEAKSDGDDDSVVEVPPPEAVLGVRSPTSRASSPRRATGTPAPGLVTSPGSAPPVSNMGVGQSTAVPATTLFPTQPSAPAPAPTPTPVPTQAAATAPATVPAAPTTAPASAPFPAQPPNSSAPAASQPFPPGFPSAAYPNWGNFPGAAAPAPFPWAGQLPPYPFPGAPPSAVPQPDWGQLFYGLMGGLVTSAQTTASAVEATRLREEKKVEKTKNTAHWLPENLFVLRVLSTAENGWKTMGVPSLTTFAESIVDLKPIDATLIVRAKAKREGWPGGMLKAGLSDFLKKGPVAENIDIAPSGFSVLFFHPSDFQERDRNEFQLHLQRVLLGSDKVSEELTRDFADKKAFTPANTYGACEMLETAIIFLKAVCGPNTIAASGYQKGLDMIRSKRPKFEAQHRKDKHFLVSFLYFLDKVFNQFCEYIIACEGDRNPVASLKGLLNGEKWMALTIDDIMQSWSIFDLTSRLEPPPALRGVVVPGGLVDLDEAGYHDSIGGDERPSKRQAKGDGGPAWHYKIPQGEEVKEWQLPSGQKLGSYFGTTKGKDNLSWMPSYAHHKTGQPATLCLKYQLGTCRGGGLCDHAHIRPRDISAGDSKKISENMKRIYSGKSS